MSRDDSAADIAGLQADVRRLDGRIDADHEYLESVSAKGQETARTVHELEVQGERTAGRLSACEVAQEKGSERMKVIETKIDATEARLNWYAGALALLGFAAPFAAALVAKILGW